MRNWRPANFCSPVHRRSAIVRNYQLRQKLYLVNVLIIIRGEHAMPQSLASAKDQLKLTFAPKSPSDFLAQVNQSGNRELGSDALKKIDEVFQRKISPRLKRSIDMVYVQAGCIVKNSPNGTQ